MTTSKVCDSQTNVPILTVVECSSLSRHRYLLAGKVLGLRDAIAASRSAVRQLMHWWLEWATGTTSQSRQYIASSVMDVAVLASLRIRLRSMTFKDVGVSNSSASGNIINS